MVGMRRALGSRRPLRCVASLPRLLMRWHQTCDLGPALLLLVIISSRQRGTLASAVGVRCASQSRRLTKTAPRKSRDSRSC